MRFEVKARIYDVLRASLSLELETDTEELARKEALALLRAKYSDSAIITVFAKALKHEPGTGGGQDAQHRV